VSEKVTYYAVTLHAGNRAKPDGLARRRWLSEGGIEDEMLRQDLTWKRDTIIVEWKRGEATEELHQISEDEANVLMERFKQRWEGAS
jgi:hypothetical protein